MAIHIKTNNPAKLLEDFKEKIDKNSVATWSYDKDGDFTHTPDQWRNKAWLRPRVKSTELVFNILGQKSITMKSLTYAVFHGRFIESMLNHCDQLFTEASASALPEDGDNIGLN